MAADKDLDPATAPDPDEDDLDDLDEMLDEFSATQLDSSTTAPKAPGASGPGRPSASSTTKPSTASDEDDFARQLQQGMAEMLQELEENPEMAKQFEELMAQFGAPPDAAAATREFVQAPGRDPSAASPSGASKGISKDASAETAQAHGEDGAEAKPAPSFQDTIRETMNRMKASSDSAAAAAVQGESAGALEGDEFMEQFLKQLSGGGEGDEGFSKMLLGMMEQLTNKEILYQPMKDLDDQFDPWLEEKKDSLDEADAQKYREQRGLVREIVQRFERPEYSDDKSEDREFIVERMQKMQALGAPPAELVGDVQQAQDMLGDLDTGCPQQ